MEASSSSSSSSSAVYQNVIGMVLSLVYVQVVVSLCDWAVRRKLMTLTVSRKTVHIAAASLGMFSVLFDASHWTRILNSVVPAMYGIQLIVKGLILADPHDHDVKTMSRTGKPIELCQGPLFFVFIMLYTNLLHFQSPVSTYIMAAVGFGDGIAPIIGTYFPWFYYNSIFGGNDLKTLSGSVAVFVGTIFGVVLIQTVSGVPAELHALTAIGVALVATIAEGISGKWDNVVIALSVRLFLLADLL